MVNGAVVYESSAQELSASSMLVRFNLKLIPHPQIKTRWHMLQACATLEAGPGGSRQGCRQRPALRRHHRRRGRRRRQPGRQGARAAACAAGAATAATAKIGGRTGLGQHQQPRAAACRWLRRGGGDAQGCGPCGAAAKGVAGACRHQTRRHQACRLNSSGCGCRGRRCCQSVSSQCCIASSSSRAHPNGSARCKGCQACGRHSDRRRQQDGRCGAGTAEPSAI